MSLTVPEPQIVLSHDLRLIVVGSMLRLERLDGTHITPLAVASAPESFVGTLPIQEKNDITTRLRHHIQNPVTGKELIAIGTALADAILPDPLSKALCEQIAQTPMRSLLRLRLSFPRPNDISPASPADTLRNDHLLLQPWEYLYLSSLGFLALHPQVRLVREIAGYAPPPHPLMIPRETHLRTLLVGANPTTARFPFMAHLQPELDSIRTILHTAPECRRRVEVEMLSEATPTRLRTILREFQPHVLHLVCHGERLPSGLAFALHGKDPKTEELLYQEDLARWIQDLPLRLIVLSACDSALIPQDITRAVSAGGTWDVIAMQFPLRDITARQFARAFYSAFSETFHIEDSLWQARQAVQGAGPDWGVPTLYRTTDNMQAESRDTASQPYRGAPSTPSAGLSPAPPLPLPQGDRAFIGRVGPVSDILRLFRHQSARLVTVTGIGGMGKTTLARQCAHLLFPDYPDGVFWVELDSLNQRDQIVSAISAALDLATSSLSSEEQLRRALARRRTLLVLDCFERHIANADILESLLRSAPGLHCLVTSRVILGLAREYEYPLSPMSVPPSAPSSISLSADGSEGTPSDNETFVESVALFAEATTHVQHDFRLDDDNRATIEEVCRRLEGLPLSIVLAAGRLRYLTPLELLEQVRVRPLQVLRRRGGQHDRHTALQNVIADSFALLEKEEQILLEQLGVFAGGFYMEDALAICDQSQMDGDIFEGIGRLRENSLLQSGVFNGRTRYHLLDTVREYINLAQSGSEALPSNLFETRLRHMRYFLRVAQSMRQRYRQGEWQGLAADLSTHIGNFRAAIRTAIEQDDAPGIVSFADSLVRFFIEAGYGADFDTLAQAAMRAHDRVDEPGMRVRLLSWRAQMAQIRGEMIETRSLLERVVAEAEQQGDLGLLADTLFELANHVRTMQDIPESLRLLERAKETAEQAGNSGLVASSLALQALVNVSQGATNRALQLAEETKTALLRGATPDTAIFVYFTLGAVFRVLESEEAEVMLLKAVSQAREVGDTFSMTKALLELGPLYETQRNLPQATRAYLAAHRVHAHQRVKRRLLTTSALRTFRHQHGLAPEVQAVWQEIRRASWSEIVAQLLWAARLETSD